MLTVRLVLKMLKMSDEERKFLAGVHKCFLCRRSCLVCVKSSVFVRCESSILIWCDRSTLVRFDQMWKLYTYLCESITFIFTCESSRLYDRSLSSAKTLYVALCENIKPNPAYQISYPTRRWLKKNEDDKSNICDIKCMQLQPLNLPPWDAEDTKRAGCDVAWKVFAT